MPHAPMAHGLDDPGEPLTIEVVTPGSPEHLAALHLALDAAVPAQGSPASPAVTRLLETVDRGKALTDLLLVAYQGRAIIAACVCVETPGRAAIVLGSSDHLVGEKYRAAVALLRAVQLRAWDRSICLLEALVAPQQSAFGFALAEAGFRRLTRLLYLDRTVRGRAQVSNRTLGLNWVSYAPDREAVFAEAIERSYAQSLDCPELSGLRSTREVLAGHRATGVFDPALWWVARRGDRPAGLILLSRIAGGRAVELVYMGVAPEDRGAGVGDALLERGLALAAEADATVLALAVDERNGPARRLYARWGFTETAAREAWIVTSPQI